MNSSGINVGNTEEGVAITVEEILSMPTNHEKCLLMNKVYQELICHTIQRLEIILEENLEQQQFINEGRHLSKNYKRNLFDAFNCSGTKNLAIFSVPYFRSRGGFVQKPNEDTQRKVAKKHIDPYIKPPLQWKARDKEMLKNAVLNGALQQLLQPHLIREQDLFDKLNDPKLNKAETEERLRECRAAMDEIKSYDDMRLLSSQIQEYDWLQISSITFDGKRTPIECELIWKNYVSPEVNTKKWTFEEDELLERLIATEGDNWDSIAENLNTKRTALQCFERYKCNFSEEVTNRYWSPENDENLFRVVEKLRVGNFIPWHQVAYHCERTKQEVHYRWKYTLDPNLKHGKWTETEDLCLVACVMRYGEKFSKISNLIPGRNNIQCRDRYRNSLERTICNGSWSAEEDNRLIHLVDIGVNLRDISFEGRTHQMIRKRYMTLTAFKEKYGDSDDVRPRTSIKKTNKYRDNIYDKVLQLLKETNPKTVKIALSLTSEIELDNLISKFEYQLKNPVVRKSRIKPELKFSPEDKAFVQHSVLTANPFIGRRPITQVECEIPESACNSEVERIVQSLACKLINPRTQIIIKKEYPAVNEVKTEIVRNYLTSSQISANEMKLIAPCLSNSRSLRFLSMMRSRFTDHISTDIYKARSKLMKLNERAPVVQKFTLCAKRFISLFFMPALMAKVLSQMKIEEKIPLADKIQNSVRPKKVKRKRKLKKPWVKHANSYRWVNHPKRMKNTNSESAKEIDTQPAEEIATESAKKTDAETFTENLSESTNTVSETVEIEAKSDVDIETENTTKKKRGRPYGKRMAVFPVQRRSTRIQAKKPIENE